MTAEEFLERVSSREIAEWRAYYRLEAEDAEERENGQQVWRPPGEVGH
jgi:hypothetical protein